MLPCNSNQIQSQPSDDCPSTSNANSLQIQIGIQTGLSHHPQTQTQLAKIAPRSLNPIPSNSANMLTPSNSIQTEPVPMPIPIPTCANCATQTTPLWRRDEAGNTLCNACALFLKMKGRPRPISLKTDFIKQRNRSKASDKEKEKEKEKEREKEMDKHPSNNLPPPPPPSDLSPRPKRRKSSPLAALLRPARLPATRTVSADRCRLPPHCARPDHHLALAQAPQPPLPVCPDSRAGLPAEQQSRGRARLRQPVISLPPLAQLVGARGASEHAPRVSRGPPTSFEASAREARYHSPPIQQAHLQPRARPVWLDPGGRAGSVISSVSDTDSVVSGAPSPASTTQRDAPLTPPVGARLAPIAGQQSGPLEPHEEVRRLRERVAELELINGIMQSRIGELGAAKRCKRTRGGRRNCEEDDQEEQQEDEDLEGQGQVVCQDRSARNHGWDEDDHHHAIISAHHHHHDDHHLREKFIGHH